MLAAMVAGCADEPPPEPAPPDCSAYQESETPPFVPDGAVRLNEGCDARCPAIAAAGDGFLVAWSERGADGELRLRLRRLDSTGAPSSPVQDVPGVGCTAMTHENGITAVAYFAARIWLARFDDSGMPIGEPVLAITPTGTVSPAIAASPDGYALIWKQDRSYYGPQDIYFAVLDEEGVLVGEPRLLAAGLARRRQLAMAFGRSGVRSGRLRPRLRQLRRRRLLHAASDVTEDPVLDEEGESPFDIG